MVLLKAPILMGFSVNNRAIMVYSFAKDWLLESGSSVHSRRWVWCMRALTSGWDSMRGKGKTVEKDREERRKKKEEKDLRLHKEGSARKSRKKNGETDW